MRHPSTIASITFVICNILLCNVLLAQNFMTKSFRVRFPNQQANQVCYIQIPTGIKIWGNIQIELTGGYNSQLNRGMMRKRIDIVYNGTSGSYLNQNSTISEASEPLASQWNIGEFDPATGRIPIYHLRSTANDISVKVDIHSVDVTVIPLLADGISVSAPETSATPMPPRPYRYINENRIGIGTTSPEHRLDVVGTIRAHEILVNTQKTADFVFEENYKLTNLDSLKQFLQIHKHLPNIPSATEMKKEGVNVGNFQIDLLQKIEELTLYIIQANETIQKQQTQIAELERKVAY